MGSSALKDRYLEGGEKSGVTSYVRRSRLPGLRHMVLNRLIARTLAASAAATIPVTTAPAAAAATATTTAALFTRSGFVDGECAAFHVFAGHAFNGRLRPFGRGHGDKGEAARAAGGTVGHEIDLIHRAEWDEKILQIVFGDIEGEIPHEQFRIQFNMLSIYLLTASWAVPDYRVSNRH